VKYSKYRAKKTKIDNIEFDSMKEAKRYTVLKAMEKACKIEKLKLQVPFELLPTTHYRGETIRKTVYKADFTYTMDGKEIVEDVKGVETPIFRLKRKLLLMKYPEINFMIT
jgi:hypothetical protein